MGDDIPMGRPLRSFAVGGTNSSGLDVLFPLHPYDGCKLAITAFRHLFFNADTIICYVMDIRFRR